MRISSKWIQYIIMKQHVLCNENTVVKLLVRVLQDPHWEHFVRIHLRAHPGNTWYNRNKAGRGQREKTFYPVSFHLVKGGQEWQTCACVSMGWEATEVHKTVPKVLLYLCKDTCSAFLWKHCRTLHTVWRVAGIV